MNKQIEIEFKDLEKMVSVLHQNKNLPCLKQVKMLKNQAMRLAESQNTQPKRLSPEQIVSLIDTMIAGQNAAGDIYLRNECELLVDETANTIEVLQKLKTEGPRAFLG